MGIKMPTKEYTWTAQTLVVDMIYVQLSTIIKHPYHVPLQTDEEALMFTIVAEDLNELILQGENP